MSWINDLICTLSDENIAPASSGTTTDDVEYSTLSPEQKLEADTKIAEAEWVRFTSVPVISKPEELPCKRVFSSSKETDMLHRSQLSPETMEMFQVLKFHGRLDFNNKWIASEAELSVADISLELVDEMLADSWVSELSDLLTNNDSSSNL